uniref:Uncharacterized protein n=1 Tax=Rhodosorus marinus TaxID=101924 RepID=A0A7S2ZPF9_9RHOD|mmetsp:Transcript_25272/g.99813  ORF Transcript_25272/g.99813 Transcript_25272/m.99813 type:complete len:215 (+) Transcript_25272:79-723(+)
MSMDATHRVSGFVCGTALSTQRSGRIGKLRCGQTRPSRVVIVPNNQYTISSAKAWYSWLKDEVSLDVEVAESFPNPYDANTKRWERVWLNYMRDELKIDSSTIAIGHGSGADALLRFLENYPAYGSILIAPGDEYHAGERHGRPHHWVDIRRNCLHFIEHIYSIDDGFVTEGESRFVASQLKAKALELRGRGRLSDSQFPEVKTILTAHLQSLN